MGGTRAEYGGGRGEGARCLEDLGANVRMILKQILEEKRWVVVDWIDLTLDKDT